MREAVNSECWNHHKSTAKSANMYKRITNVQLKGEKSPPICQYATV